MADIVSAKYITSSEGSPIQITYDDNSVSLIYGFENVSVIGKLLSWIQAGGGQISPPDPDGIEGLEFVSFARRKGTDEYLILNSNGKALLSLGVESDGTPFLRVRDNDGNHIDIPRQQTVTLTFNNTKTATISFPKPFKKIPRIAGITLSQPTSPAYRSNANKTSLTMAFATVFNGTVEVIAVER